jgi:hypothetical protein
MRDRLSTHIINSSTTIRHQISVYRPMRVDFGRAPSTSRVVDARRIRNTTQGEAIEGNATDDALMVDQGRSAELTSGLEGHSFSVRKWRAQGLERSQWKRLFRGPLVKA